MLRPSGALERKRLAQSVDYADYACEKGMEVIKTLPRNLGDPSSCVSLLSFRPTSADLPRPYTARIISNPISPGQPDSSARDDVKIHIVRLHSKSTY